MDRQRQFTISSAGSFKTGDANLGRASASAGALFISMPGNHFFHAGLANYDYYLHVDEHPPRQWVVAMPLAAACFLLAAILIAIAVFSERIEAELSLRPRS